MSLLKQAQFRVTGTSLRAPVIWLRHRGLTHEDVFIASYPRSGSTWLRFILTDCLTSFHADFDNINRAIPEIGLQSRAQQLLPGNGRLIKTHERWRTEYRKAIYLVRDPRDVMLSNFARAQELGLIPEADASSFVMPFLTGKYARAGTWREHVRSWMESPIGEAGNLLTVRF